MERTVRDDELLEDVPPAIRSDEPRESVRSLPPPLPPPPRFPYDGRDKRTSSRPGELVHLGPAYPSPRLVTVPPPVLVDRSSLLGLAAIVVFGQVIGTAAAVYIANDSNAIRATPADSQQRLSVDALKAVPEGPSRARERAAGGPIDVAPVGPALAPHWPVAAPSVTAPPARLGVDRPAKTLVQRVPSRPEPTAAELPASEPSVARAGLFDTVY